MFVLFYYFALFFLHKSSICVLELYILALFKIFLLNFGTGSYSVCTVVVVVIV